MKRLSLTCVLLAACGGGASDVAEAGHDAAWMSGFSYTWQFFNHRISFLDVRVSEEGVSAGVIGGTSTSGLNPTLPSGCEESGCDELPFADFADLTLDWGRVTGADASFAATTVSLTADADGEQAEARAELVGASDAAPVSAIVRGLRIDTDHPIDGEQSCYLPRNGWLPTHMAIELGEVSVDGDELSVTVDASFRAGKTLEDMRGCIDDVTERARVAVEVDVLFIAGGGAASEALIVGQASYPHYDESGTEEAEQPLPAAEEPGLGLAEPLTGWRSMSWSFHSEDAQDRGAYLRSVVLQGDPDAALGAATNYSPPTQLSGFDYQFEGTLVGHEVGGVMETGQIVQTLDVLTEADGTAISQELGAPWAR